VELLKHLLRSSVLLSFTPQTRIFFRKSSSSAQMLLTGKIPENSSRNLKNIATKICKVQPPGCWKFQQKKVVFLILSGKSQIFYHFWPPGKMLENSPSAPSWKIMLPTPVHPCTTQCWTWSRTEETALIKVNDCYISFSTWHWHWCQYCHR